jgi:hypothetical protein
MLADWMGILRDGRVAHSAPLEQLRAQVAAETGQAAVTIKTLYLALTGAAAVGREAA